MQKNLVIVESPAKAKTIEKFLGKDFKVLSSYGHIRDLKKKEFSIDIEKNFKPKYEIPAEKQELVDKLLTRIQGVIQARESKYIMMHAPTERLEEVIALLPGAERPTILPLAGDKQRVAMHMVSSETLFWETMEKLKALGASSILVLPIEKMME